MRLEPVVDYDEVKIEETRNIDTGTTYRLIQFFDSGMPSFELYSAVTVIEEHGDAETGPTGCSENVINWELIWTGYGVHYKGIEEALVEYYAYQEDV